MLDLYHATRDELIAMVLRERDTVADRAPRHFERSREMSPAGLPHVRTPRAGVTKIDDFGGRRAEQAPQPYRDGRRQPFRDLL